MRSHLEFQQQSSEQWLKAFINHSVDAIITINTDSIILIWNPAAERMFGHSAADVLGKSVAEIIIPTDYQERHYQGMKRFLSTGEGPLINKTVEIEACRKDGSLFPIELSLFQSNDSATPEFTGIIRDITRRKRLESDLEKANENLNAIVQMQTSKLASASQRELLAHEISEGIRSEVELDTILKLIVDRMGALVEADRCTIWLYDEETDSLNFHGHEYRKDGNVPSIKDMPNPNWVLQVPELNFERIVSIPDIYSIQNLTADDITYIEERKIKSLLHVPISYKNKHLGVLRVHTGLAHDWDAETMQLLSNMANQISVALYQAKTLKDVQKSEANFRAIFDNAIHLISIHDNEGRYLQINQSGCELLGYSADEVVGRFPDELYSVEGEDLRGEWGHLKGECTLVRFDGTARELEYSVVANIIPGRHLVIANDITDRKLSVRKLEQYAALLKRSNEELDNFATIASHDLQSPLRKIILFTEQLKTKYHASLPEEGQESLERVIISTQRMQRLINDLLVLSRVSRKGQPFKPVYLKALVDELLSEMAEDIKHANGRVEVGPMMTIDADGSQIRQALQNLVGNALKFHQPDEAPTIRIWSEKIDDNTCRIYVCDNGIGIDPKYWERIFIIFERLHQDTEYEGTGIGLAICQKIVERHQGQISVKSKPGKGTTFMMDLPIHHSKDEA